MRRFFRGLHHAGGDACLLEVAHQLLGGLAAGPGGDDLVQPVLVAEAIKSCGEARVRRPLGVTCSSGKRLPFLVGGAHDGDPAVIVVITARRALVCAVRGVLEMASAQRDLLPPIDRVIEDHRFGGVDRRFHLAEVDVLALAGALAMVECGDQGDRGKMWHEEIGVGHARADRLLARVVRQV